ncbi:hypothetical protein QP986_10620 [Corynebacterium striatum]|uniref:hypothetical protein n=1 Tax=Corynebacterium striatum TaxID=43770 RepID=UPI0025511188|nr:hypothetical protein [Corynebacterium striatum]MDK8844518.1 hypothetical protein [Corynebacterium striatum]
MTTNTKKTPTSATNTHEGNDDPSINSNHDQHTVTAHLRRTGGAYFDGRPVDRQAGEDAEDRAKREREAQHEAVLAKQRARAEEERAIIRQVTGRHDISRLDLPVMLVDDYRAGRDVTVWLDALKALDDAALKRAGRTSWGDDEEDDDV